MNGIYECRCIVSNIHTYLPLTTLPKQASNSLSVRPSIHPFPLPKPKPKPKPKKHLSNSTHLHLHTHITHITHITNLATHPTNQLPLLPLQTIQSTKPTPFRHNKHVSRFSFYPSPFYWSTASHINQVHIYTL